MPADGFDAEAAAAAVRAYYPDAVPLSAEGFQRFVVGKSFTTTLLASGLTITSPRTIYLTDGTYQTGHRVVRFGTWTFADGVLRLESEEDSQKQYLFQSEGAILSVGGADGILSSLNFEQMS